MKWVASLKKRKKKTDKIENVDDHLQGNEGINEPVYLNVYDISHLNTYFYWTGIGIYHSGVEVYGMEYAFAAHDCPTTGIFEVEPRKCPKFKFRKSIFMGMTNKNPIQINDLFENQSKNYKGNAYHLISNNCNHFTTDICDKLCLRPVPKWINRIARIVALCNCISPEDKNDRNLSSIPEDENDSEQLPAKTEEKEVIQYIPRNDN
ncbi:PPPDE putative thiol peptidase family protein [Zostera marina]|uniref:PPPDE putative thiol peptidase family protein n=1 Tax=Zostera marina TaxID=29655 RepID=A0A0K9PR45_ZOSMR|nr:PPPDE putative thiol peptidase family protein [Zostera marina]